MNYAILLISMVLSSCTLQNDPNKKIVDRFLQAIMADSITMNNADIFFDTATKFPWAEEETWIGFNAVFDSYKKHLDENDNSYTILAQKDFQNHPDYQHYEKHYSKLSNVYFVRLNSEGTLPIIVANGKINSFFTNISKGNNEDLSPALLEITDHK